MSAFKKTLNKVGFGILCGFAVAGLCLLMGILRTYVFEIEVNSNQISGAEGILAQPFRYFISACIIAPILEEIIFRGIIFGLFAKINRILAYIVSSLAFALLHMDFSAHWISEAFGFAIYFLSALIFAFAYEKKGITASVPAHATNNIISFLAILI
jgi:membrane protease YdiL (CAAX protease family)